MKFDYDAQYFNPEHTLECGQIFRFLPHMRGYFVISGEKACYVYTSGNKTVVECDDGDYFYNFFDLATDYSKIVKLAKSYNIPLLTQSAEMYKGLRLLNQNREEMIYSFIISQNNNIPRIKGIISNICGGLSQISEFSGQQFYPFPSTEKLAAAGKEFFRAAGCGYRDSYLAETSERIAAEGIGKLESLKGDELKKQLLTYKGVGGKVADCIALFGFGQRGAFPVDTWVEKIYREDFKGTSKSRESITKYFTNLFGDYSGYIQQYLFYGKRQNL